MGAGWMEVFGVHGGKTDEADETKKETREWELQAPLFRLRINQVFRYLVDRPSSREGSWMQQLLKASI